MRMMTTTSVAVLLVALAAGAGAQAPAPPPTDRTQATRFSAADLQAALAQFKLIASDLGEVVEE